MRTALRTAVATALVAGVAITAPAFAAGAAFAADGPVAVKPAATAPAPAGTEAPEAGAAEAAGEAAKTTAPKTTAPKTEAPKAEAPKAEAVESQESGTYVRTQILPNGGTAKIFKAGTLHHIAELYKEGQRVGTLDADNRPVAGNDDGTFLVLFETGLTSTWQGNYVPGARPGLYELANGSRVELVVKLGVWTLQTVENGETRVLTTLNGTRKVVQYGKAVIVVEPDGGLAAYINGSVRQAAPRLVEAPDTTPAPAPTAGPVVTIGECTVRQEIPSVFALLTVTLTNDLEKGPKAVLKDENGKAIVTLDRATAADRGMGLTIKGADTVTPQLGQRTQGGDTPYRWTAFPKLPKGCEKDATATPAPTVTTPATGSNGSNGTTTNNAGQTSVIPRGGVAAGAQLGAEGDSTALIAAGAGAASLAAAGLGFVVLRRRAAARV
ncbi:hypothetical protein OG361_25075 [Streptomyces sp. NBC_00090]|uniref:hypothetical protein n=1 Tax=Streptomyces sp. NBC_00090 TaxID=2903619 RepID=UPI003253130E